MAATQCTKLLRVTGCDGAGPAKRSYPHPRSGAARRSHLAPEARGGGKEITLVQDKEEQWLCFAGAAVKRYPTPKVRNPSKMVIVARGHQRTDTLKPYSQKTSQSYHTRTTALSNSMKPSHARRATQDGQVMVERSDKVWSTGEGNGKPLQYSCLENPMNSMKRQNDRIPKEELPGH